MTIRSNVMVAITEKVRSWNTTQARAARRLGITQPRLDDLLRGKINKFSLDILLTLAIRAGLKEMSPPAADGGGKSIQALALHLLNEGLQPFLAEWRPRYRRFAESERPEAKWGRAEACRAALAATIERCQPTIRALGHKVGAPFSPEPNSLGAHTGDEAPLQLPPPVRL